MERLSSGAEQLLKDIFEHRLENGACDLEYWSKRFKELESDLSKDTQIRSQFGTLRRQDMIDVRWASDEPYILLILDNGFAYYERYLLPIRQEEQTQMYDVNVFVSYNQNTGSGFADALEKKLERKATVLRDKSNIPSWGSISDFMRSIREQDFVVAVITDAYLKSQACMYEIAMMLREHDWQNRIIPAVLETDIYGNKSEYVQYWAQKKQGLEDQIKQAKDLSEVQIHAQDIEQISKISAEISSFLAFILDRKNPPIYTVLDEIEKRVLSSAPPSVLPTEFLEKTEVYRVRQKLSKKAELLLIRAAKAQKRILFIQNMSGCSLGLDGEDGEQSSNDRIIAQWEEMISQLKSLGFIEQADIAGRLYKLTNKGYQIADKLEIEQLLD